jgi:hypothetical protein
MTEFMVKRLQVRQYKLICIFTFDFNRVEIDAESAYTRDRMRPTANMNIATIGQDNAKPVFTNCELTDQLTNQPTKHPTNQPTSLLTNQLIK